MLVLDVQL